jgi:hypothetical protein
MTKYFVPVTPAGTPIPYGTTVDVLAATSREKAIENLLREAAHMPYHTWAIFEKRGYTIEEWEGWEP